MPAINEAMEKASALPPGAERTKAWGEIDRMVVEQAAAIPWIWDKVPTVQSADVRAVVNQSNTSWDLSFTSLK